jgi:gluconolactonase
MKRICATVPFLVSIALGLAFGQTLNLDVLVRKDPALNKLISPNARLEQLANTFGFLEGPVWVADGDRGYLAVTDMPANVIYKWTPWDRKFGVLVDKCGYTGVDIWRVGMPQNNGREQFFLHGCNGNALDPQGRLVMAGWGSRKIERVDLKTGRRDVLAERYDGKRFGGPNDIIVKKNGTIYFTDGFGGMRGRQNDPSKELEIAGAFMLKDGRVTLVKEIGGANGIMLSPDEKYLYVSNGGGKIIYRFDVQADDAAVDGKPFIDLSGDKTPGIIDGMKVDAEGNVWTSCCGGVHILTADGNELGMIKTPNLVSNLTFGDADWKTLYITARMDLYRIRTLVPGIPGR